MSAYLIAQLGKNFADGRNNRITGAEMLELAWSVIEEMQYMGGGMVVFLEANNDDKLFHSLIPDKPLQKIRSHMSWFSY